MPPGSHWRPSSRVWRPAVGFGEGGWRKSGNPLRVYAGLELGIAVTALLYFVVLRGYHAIYPEVYQSVHSGAWLLLIKFLLAVVLIFPPAFCMGGTIPVVGQHAIRKLSRFGSASALLYGVNTLGAALGALLAGFYLPLWFGFRGTCLTAVGVTLIVAALAWLVSRSSPAPHAVEDDTPGEGASANEMDAHERGMTDGNRAPDGHLFPLWFQRAGA